MEKKKNPKADLEKSRSIFFLIGLIVAMGGVFAAFNISTEITSPTDISMNDAISFEDQLIPITEREPEKQVEQKKQEIKLEELIIVEDDKKVIDWIPESSETNEDEEMHFNDIVVPQKKEIEDEEPIFIPSKMPVFPGGEKGLMKYIFDQVVYPSLAREQGIEGKVYVRFCVTKFGTVDRVSIARGADPLLDKEALRVVKLLPKWEPGENGGRKVSVWYTVPINFKLN
ncbi:MAG: energy transducer TonB [Chloroflexia bacterium]|nr:energy transducer TonB [Chloroflexia bacterium]